MSYLKRVLKYYLLQDCPSKTNSGENSEINRSKKDTFGKKLIKINHRKQNSVEIIEESDNETVLSPDSPYLR